MDADDAARYTAAGLGPLAGDAVTAQHHAGWAGAARQEWHGRAPLVYGDAHCDLDIASVLVGVQGRNGTVAHSSSSTSSSSKRGREPSRGGGGVSSE